MFQNNLTEINYSKHCLTDLIRTLQNYQNNDNYFGDI